MRKKRRFLSDFATFISGQVHGNRSRRGDFSRLETCTTRNSHSLGYVKTAVILARRYDRERLRYMLSKLLWKLICFFSDRGVKYIHSQTYKQLTGRKAVNDYKGFFPENFNSFCTVQHIDSDESMRVCMVIVLLEVLNADN